MKNNIVFRQLRYIFDLSDGQMIDIFAQAELEVTRSEVSDWLKKDDDPEYSRITDQQFCSFLDGLINVKRGKKEGKQPEPLTRLNNNIIFRKLKIALAYKDTDIIEAFKKADFEIGKHEISAIFRNPNQSQYRKCEDQFLRNFLHGLQKTLRPSS